MKENPQNWEISSVDTFFFFLTSVTNRHRSVVNCYILHVAFLSAEKPKTICQRDQLEKIIFKEG